MRKLLFTTAVAVLVWAAAVVPVPLAALEPVEAQPVAGIIEVQGGTTDELADQLLFTAVRVRQPSTVGAVQVLLDEHRDLTVIQTVVPPGIDPEEFAQLQERLFDESIRAAAAVGLRAAGLDVVVEGEGAHVESVVPGTPAAEHLQQQDVITAVDGQQISLASELAAALSGQAVGDEVELTVRRDEEERTETIELTGLSELGTPGIGVLVSTVDLAIDLPVDVRATSGARVGGPSAGLMIALAVYDAATDESLTGGRTIAGTGTMDLTGRVGQVSAVQEKVRGAVLAGAELFLVPEVHAEEARRAAPDELEVVVVETLQDAIGVLTD